MLSVKGQDKIDERRKFLQESLDGNEVMEIQENGEDEDGDKEVELVNEVQENEGEGEGDEEVDAHSYPVVEQVEEEDE